MYCNCKPFYHFYTIQKPWVSGFLVFHQNFIYDIEVSVYILELISQEVISQRSQIWSIWFFIKNWSKCSERRCIKCNLIVYACVCVLFLFYCYSSFASVAAVMLPLSVHFECILNNFFVLAFCPRGWWMPNLWSQITYNSMVTYSHTFVCVC